MPSVSAVPSIAVKPAAVLRPGLATLRPGAGQMPGGGQPAARPAAPMRPGVKAPARVLRYKDLAFRPRFAYGEMCSLAEICGAGFGTEMGFGIARFTKARIPWAIKYDEVLMVISGVLRVRTGGRVLEAGPHDSIWLPAGTELVYEADDALVAYAVHPLTSTPSAGVRS
jgi:ethanolamine utilization protein EutQ